MFRLSPAPRPPSSSGTTTVSANINSDPFGGMGNKAQPRQPPSQRANILEFKGISGFPAEIPLSRQSRIQQLPEVSPPIRGLLQWLLGCHGSHLARAPFLRPLHSGWIPDAGTSDPHPSAKGGGGSLGRQPRWVGTARALGNAGFQIPSQTHGIHR